MRHLAFCGRRLPAACALVAMALSAAGVASAAIIAEEDFTYADGGLAGGNGGSGWAGDWTSADAGGTIVGNQYQNSSTAETENSRILSNPIGADGTTVWMSFLGRRDSSEAGWAGVHLYNSTAASHDSGGADHFGESERTIAAPVASDWTMTRTIRGGSHNDDHSAISGNAGGDPTVDQMVVFKFEFGAGSTFADTDSHGGHHAATAAAAGDLISMWVVGAGVTALSPTPDVVLDVYDMGIMDQVRLRSHPGFGTPLDGKVLHVDNFILGDTAADVGKTIIPEPGTIALGLIGAIGLGLVHRRRCS